MVEVLATVVALSNVWSERKDFVLQKNIENHHRMVMLASINNKDVGLKHAISITASNTTVHSTRCSVDVREE